MTRTYNLTFNNPYNRKIANKIISLEMMKNNTGEPELFKNNRPQSTKPLSGGALRISSKSKAQLNRMLKRGRGMMEGGNATSAPVPSCIMEMDEVQPMRRPGEFIKPVKDLQYNILSYETNASNSPYYNQLELDRVNNIKLPFFRRATENSVKKVKDVKRQTPDIKPDTNNMEGGFSRADNVRIAKAYLKAKNDNKKEGGVAIPARKVGGKRVAGIGEYKGGFSFSGIGKAIASAAKKIPSLIKKGAPKLAKSAFKFMKGPEGQKVIGNVLSEVGTQAVKKIFEAPPALQEENVLGSGIKVDMSREDIVDGKMRDAFDKLVVNGELRKDRLPLVRRIMKKSDMGTTKKEMTGGIIPIILGIIGAVAAAASATHGIVTAENERAKASKASDLRSQQVVAEQLAERYIERQKKKGVDVDVKNDPIIKQLKNKKKELEVEATKLGGALSQQDIFDKILDAMEKGGELKAGKSTAKKGLEPKKAQPTKIPVADKKVRGQSPLINPGANGVEPRKGGFNPLGLINTLVKSTANSVNKKGGAKCGGAKPKRKISDKMKKRAELVKKIMKERGVKLAEASKIIKQEKLM